MSDIKLDPAEMALWNETGTRGDAFRRATLDRVAEQSRLGGRMAELIDGENNWFVATEGLGEADPEPTPPRHPVESHDHAEAAAEERASHRLPSRK